MALIRVFDDLIVALGADMFLHLHATPSPGFSRSGSSSSALSPWLRW